MSSELFRMEIESAESTEEYLIKAFGESDYQLEDVDESRVNVQNAQVPAQLIARVNGSVKQDGNYVIRDSEIYARLLLDESEDGVVVSVQDTS